MSRNWPRWSLTGEDVALARYVLPDRVQQLVGSPAGSGAGVRERLTEVYARLARVGVEYAHEATSDDRGRQVIRPPDWVLRRPRQGTCLDLAVTLAAAGLGAGLHPILILLGSAGSDNVGHAVVGFWIGQDQHYPDTPVAGWWPQPPAHLADLLARDLADTAGSLLVVDPVGFSVPLPGTTVPGTNVDLAAAVQAGHRHVTTRPWRLGLDVTVHDQDRYDPGEAPADRNRPETWKATPNYTLVDTNFLKTVDDSWLRSQPNRMLVSQFEVVEFDHESRALEMGALRAWRVSAITPPAVLLIHGPGGQGKTRLANELARESAAEGWLALHAVRSIAGAASEPAMLSKGSPRDVLIILDYAERWPLNILQALLSDVDLHRSNRLRIILLARRSDTWWADLRRIITERLFMHAEDMPLGPLADTAESRSRTFYRAAHDFARRYELGEKASQSLKLPEWVADDRSGTILTPHMAALAAVDAASKGQEQPTGLHQLSTYLLGRERDQWVDSFQQGGGGVNTHPDVMAQAVYAAILTRGSSFESGLRTLANARVAKDPDGAGKIIRDHATFYPAGNVGEVLAPLLPDRLAEDYLALQTPGHDNAEWPAAPWAKFATRRLLIGKKGAGRPSYLRDAFTMIVEAAHRWPHLIEAQLIPLLTADPYLSFHIGADCLSRLVALDPNDDTVLVERLAEFERKIPADGDYKLDMAAVDLTERIAAKSLAHDRGLSTQAFWNERLAYRNYQVGRGSKALTYAREATRQYRSLAERESSPYLPRLASSILGLAVILVQLGQYDQALSVAEEAVDRYRDLQTLGEREYVSGLALSLNNLGNIFAAAKRYEDAVEVLSEASRIYWSLVMDTTDDVSKLTDFLRSLNNLAAAYIHAKQDALAVDALKTVVETYRILMPILPRVALPGLAGALSNRAASLSRLDRNEEALENAQEAVEIHRRLVHDSPEAFKAGLAMALNNIAGLLQDLERLSGARDCAEEAVGIYEELALRDPLAVSPDLAVSLHVLEGILLALKLPHAAVTAAERAITVQRWLAARRPAYKREFASALLRFVRLLMELDHRLGALESTAEAVSAMRELSDENQAPNAMWLTLALGLFAAIRVRVRVELDAALHAAIEALTLMSEAENWSAGEFRHRLNEIYAVFVDV